MALAGRPQPARYFARHTFIGGSEARYDSRVKVTVAVHFNRADVTRNLNAIQVTGDRIPS